MALVPAVIDDGPDKVTAKSAELAGRPGEKLATAVPQLAVACALANSLTFVETVFLICVLTCLRDDVAPQ